MKKPILVLIIVGDLGFIAGAAYVLADRLHKGKPTPGTEAADQTTSTPQNTFPAQNTAPPTAPAPTPAEVKRKILFTLRVAKATRVQIAGDFTDWKPQDLTRGRKKVWSLVLPLSPGVYSYHYILNGRRKIKDPNNPRATPDRKSILTVKGNP